MRPTVVWRPAALAQLADLWINSNDRDAVALAANQIDLLLCDAPRRAALLSTMTACSWPRRCK